jgi:excinuclease ABC subunit C
MQLKELNKIRQSHKATEIVFPDQPELFPVEMSVGCLRFDLGTCLAPCTGECSRRAYAAQVKAARSFLEGKDAGLLPRLRAEMVQAAAEQRFEKAAGLRDQLATLEWLTARLDRLRQVRASLSLIYPVEGPGGAWWYLIHGGRPLLALPAPKQAEEARRLGQTLDRIYRRSDHPALAESYEHVDGMLLVSAWFRKFPKERKKTLTPEEAMRRCKAMV